MSQEAIKKPRYFKPPNILKNKVGSGGIDEYLLEKSQEFINNTEFDFVPYALDSLKQLSNSAKEATESNDDFATAKEKMIMPVMQLKANGGMFRYQLVSDVADIALQFLEAVDAINKDTLQVLQAHQNTIHIIINNKLKGDGGSEGYALIQELHKACQRYFEKHKPKAKAAKQMDL
jgi:hypothetical protein